MDIGLWDLLRGLDEIVEALEEMAETTTTTPSDVQAQQALATEAQDDPQREFSQFVEVLDLYRAFRQTASAAHSLLLRFGDRVEDCEDLEHRLFVLEERVRQLDLQDRFAVTSGL